MPIAHAEGVKAAQRPKGLAWTPGSPPSRLYLSVARQRRLGQNSPDACTRVGRWASWTNSPPRWESWS